MQMGQTLQEPADAKLLFLHYPRVTLKETVEVYEPSWTNSMPSSLIPRDVTAKSHWCLHGADVLSLVIITKKIKDQVVTSVASTLSQP